MKWPKPLRALPNPREVWSWGMYDLANQSFTLLIITVLFPIYYKQVAVGDKQRGDSLWSIGVSISLLVVVICSPFIGALADQFAARKRVLVTSGLFCALLTCSLALISPGSGWVGLLLFIPANFMYQIGENMLASFLPGLSTTRTIGKISAIGWTMGYLGGLILLIIVAFLAFVIGLKEPSQWRIIFVIAGLWFAGGMIPAMIFLDEPVSSNKEEQTSLNIRKILWSPITKVRQYKDLTLFLIAFFVYGLGVQTMIAFAAILASDFGILGNRLILFTLQLTVVAGITAILVAKYQDRLGTKLTVQFFLSIWFLSSFAMLMVRSLGPTDPPEWMFWMIGNGIGIGLGGIGTASRSMVGLFSPKSQTAEFFGLWGMSYKFAGAVGVLSFGQVKAWVGDDWALALLTGFFAIGFVLMFRVNVMRGIRDARRIDREAA